MSTRRSGPKRFTPTTMLLMIALLAAVVGASRLVTPPPPEPPKPPKEDTTSVATTQERMKDQQKRLHDEMKRKMANPPTAAAMGNAVPDPNAITISNEYFLKTQPGAKGLQQNDEQLAKMKAKYAEYRKSLAASQGKGGPVHIAPDVPGAPGAQKSSQ